MKVTIPQRQDRLVTAGQVLEDADIKIDSVASELVMRVGAHRPVRFAAESLCGCDAIATTSGSKSSSIT